MPQKPFWQVKKIREMSQTEWESLCDGCGQCCLNKLEFDDIREIHFTKAACKLLDTKTAQCTKYENRHQFVPDCITLTPRNIHKLQYMPKTCAYRLVAQGLDLPTWHPLISGDPQSVKNAGMSVGGRVKSELKVKDLENELIDWIPPIVKPPKKTKR